MIFIFDEKQFATKIYVCIFGYELSDKFCRPAAVRL
jgi:hypothetical protein